MEKNSTLLILIAIVVILNFIINVVALMKNRGVYVTAAPSYLAQVSEVVQPNNVTNTESSVNTESSNVDVKSDILRQIGDIRSRLAETRRDTKKLKLPDAPAIYAELDRITAELAGIETEMKGAVDQDEQQAVAEQFWEADYWKQQSNFQTRVQIPADLARWSKDISKLEKLLAAGGKWLAKTGINIGIVQSYLGEAKETMAQVKVEYDGGDYQEAEAKKAFFNEGKDPGTVVWFLDMRREADLLMGRIEKKNKTVAGDIKIILGEIEPLFNEGDNFQQAAETLSEALNSLNPLVEKIMASKKPPPAVLEKIRMLKESIGS